jgi:hypothetical protein
MHITHAARCVALKAVWLRTEVFWPLTLCRWVSGSRRFEGFNIVQQSPSSGPTVFQLVKKNSLPCSSLLVLSWARYIQSSPCYPISCGPRYSMWSFFLAFPPKPYKALLFSPMSATRSTHSNRSFGRFLIPCILCFVDMLTGLQFVSRKKTSRGNSMSRFWLSF